MHVLRNCNAQKLFKPRTRSHGASQCAWQLTWSRGDQSLAPLRWLASHGAASPVYLVMGILSGRRERVSESRRDRIYAEAALNNVSRRRPRGRSTRPAQQGNKKILCIESSRAEFVRGQTDERFLLPAIRGERAGGEIGMRGCPSVRPRVRPRPSVSGSRETNEKRFWELDIAWLRHLRISERESEF